MQFNKNDIKQVKLCDNITLVDTNHDHYIFNVVLDLEKGLFLQHENDSLIKELNIFNSKAFILYESGIFKVLDNQIKEVVVDDEKFQKKFNYSINGVLLTYDLSMADKYNLDSSKALGLANNQTETKKIRKRKI